jgi:hypothetical protein
VDALHRIEPRLLNTPMFYGSPGEPQLTYPPFLGPRPPPLAVNNSLAPLLLGPLALALMAPGEARDEDFSRVASGMIRRPPKPLGFDHLPFGKAFALARKLGLNEFNWKGNPYTTELK